MVDIKKFSFGELTSGANGKTSMGLVCGGLICLTACITMTYAVFTKYDAAFFHIAAFVTVGATLIGVRRFTKDKELTAPSDLNNVSPLNTDQK